MQQQQFVDDALTARVAAKPSAIARPQLWQCGAGGPDPRRTGKSPSWSELSTNGQWAILEADHAINPIGPLVLTFLGWVRAWGGAVLLRYGIASQASSAGVALSTKGR
jgi:hypothetical protein